MRLQLPFEPATKYDHTNTVKTTI